MKPKTTPRTARNFNSEKFWRHYVATEVADPSMIEEEKKGGHASRIFIFLLLLHAFLIGSVVLYNIVAERPRPAFVDGSLPGRKPTPDQNSAAPAPIQTKTIEYIVVTGDSLKSIADKTGATPEEIVMLNGLDRGGTISVGKKLLVPDRTSKSAPSPAPAPAPAAPAPQPQIAAPKTPEPAAPPVKAPPVQVVSTTKPGVSKLFQAEEPRPSPPKGAPAKVGGSDVPPEQIEAVAQKRPADPKHTEDPAPPKKAPADAPPPAKMAENKPAPKGAEPKSEDKLPEPKKTPPPAAPAVVKSQTPKPADAPKPTASKPASGGGSHTVKAGETFYSISRKYGVSPDQLMRFNGVKDPGKLKLGTVLKVPPKS